jgi:hypothetical protein
MCSSFERGRLGGRSQRRWWVRGRGMPTVEVRGSNPSAGSSTRPDTSSRRYLGRGGARVLGQRQPQHDVQQQRRDPHRPAPPPQPLRGDKQDRHGLTDISPGPTPYSWTRAPAPRHTHPQPRASRRPAAPSPSPGTGDAKTDRSADKGPIRAWTSAAMSGSTAEIATSKTTSTRPSVRDDGPGCNPRPRPSTAMPSSSPITPPARTTTRSRRRCSGPRPRSRAARPRPRQPPDPGQRHRPVRLTAPPAHPGARGDDHTNAGDDAEKMQYHQADRGPGAAQTTLGHRHNTGKPTVVSRWAWGRREG